VALPTMPANGDVMKTVLDRLDVIEKRLGLGQVNRES
jgi:hypothetical protein